MSTAADEIVLASASPQRQRLLAEAGYRFRVVEPGITEPSPRNFEDPAEYVSHTAWLKARDAARQVPAGTILAADTVVVLGGKIIGKPADAGHARRILATLSGSDHEVMTGLCLWHQPDEIWLGAFERTQLRMRPLSDQEREDYVRTDRWVGKAGAYAIQDPDPYVSIVCGSYSNVVGLPMELLERLLARFKGARA